MRWLKLTVIFIMHLIYDRLFSQWFYRLIGKLQGHQKKEKPLVLKTKVKVLSFTELFC